MASGSREEALDGIEEKLVIMTARNEGINTHSIRTSASEDLMMAGEKDTTDVVVNKIETFINSIAEKEGYKNYELKTTPISTHGANYTSSLYYVDVIEKNKSTLNLFVKFANVPANARKIIPVNLIFQHEQFMYSKVAEKYHDLQDRYGVPEEKKFKFPKCYGTNLKEMEEMMVFENLAAQGYILYDRFKPIDWEYAKAASEEIAKFHALSFALQKENPDEFEECFLRLSDITKPEVMMKDFIYASKKKIPFILSVVEDENKFILEKYFKENEDQLLIRYFQSKSSNFNAKIHTDYRASNIMVKYEGNNVVALKPVDYQIEAYGCPVNDIIYLLLLGSDEKFRKQYFEKYLENYYNSLASHLHLLSQDINEIYPRSAFYFDVKDRMLAGMEVALFTMDIIMIDPEANKTIEDFMDWDIVELQRKPNKEYVERINGIVRDFVRWGFLEEEDKSDTQIEEAFISAVNTTVENAPVDVHSRLKKFISSIAEKEGYADFELKTTPMSTHGANYTADLFYVDVVENGKEALNLFVKVANAPAQFRKKIPIGDLYKHEAFVYTTLANIYHDLQEKHRVPEEKSFKFPKYYGANLNEMEEMIVFENLAAQGYTLYDRFKPINWEYAKAAVEEIAKFHALSFALQKENPDVFEKAFDHTSTILQNEDFIRNMADSFKKDIPHILKIVEPENRSRLQKYLEVNEDQLIVRYFKNMASKYSTIIHSDFRASNIMVKYKGSDVVALKPVDYQAEVFGCPVNDIIYFLFIGSDEHFRKQYYEKFFEHYYNSMADHLKLLSQDINEIYPRSAFYFDLKEKLIAGLEFGLLGMSVLFIDPEKPKTIEDIMNPEKSLAEDNPSEEYVERVNGLVRDMARWGYFEETDQYVPVKNRVAASNNDDTEIEEKCISTMNTITESAPVDAHSLMKKFISSVAEKEGFENFELKITPISTDGANFTADLFYVDVVENGKEALNLFVKVANAPAQVRKKIHIDDLYKHEAFVYSTLANIYHDLQEKHDVPEEKRFKFPKYYGANLNEMEEMIVFENLAAQGYILYDRFKPIDWEYAKAAVEEIAKFHALSFALQKENPDAFEKARDYTPPFFHDEDMMRNMSDSFKKDIPNILKIVEPENRSRLQKYLEVNEDQLVVRYFKNMASKYSIIIHSDFRASNIMVKYKGSDVVALKPVDYQVEAFGCPVNDIIFFLCIGSDEQFRKQYYEKYFEHYYNSLADHLKLLSQDINEIYPRSAFYFDVNDRLIAGLELALLGMSVLFIDPEKPKTLEDLMNPEKSQGQDNPSEEYVERVNGIVRDMARWGYFDGIDQTDPVINQASNNNGITVDDDNKKDVVHYIEEFVCSIAKKEGFINFKLKTTPMSTEGANYLGDLFYVDVMEDGKETLNLFIKASNTPAHVRKIFPVGEIYEHEAFMYTTLADTYHKLQERHGVPEEKRFKFPKYYGANLKEMEELLVLENLSAQGYILYDRFKPVDWEYAKAAVEEIAKFHALSFVLQKENPEVFQSITQNIPDAFKDEDALNNFIETSKQGIPLVMSVIEEENKGRVQKYIDDNKDQLLAAHYKLTSKNPAIIHVDYRASNIMVKYQGNNVVSLKPVDYQGGFLGCPINDILYFIFLGSDEEFRRKHFEDYLEHYHKSLEAHLKLLSHDINDIYPKTAFYFELKDKMGYGLEVALFTLKIVLIDTQANMTIEEFIDPEKVKTETVLSQNFVERLNGIVRDFVRWGFFDKESKPVLFQNNNISTETNGPKNKSAETSNSDDINAAEENKPVDLVHGVETFITSIGKKEGIKNFELKTRPMSTNGANYTADLFYVDLIVNGKEVINFFVKAANTPPQVRKFMKIKEIYTRETFIYTVFANTYHELQEKHGVPEEKQFRFPKFYGSNVKEMEEMLVMENLSAQGYILYDRFKPIDWDYAKTTVEEIAKYHAMSFALQKENPDAFQAIMDNLLIFSEVEEILKNFMETATKRFPLILSIVCQENRSRLKKYMNKNKNNFMLKYYKPTKKYSTIVHGDFRASNIMVKYVDNKVVALKPVDYQSPFYGCPIPDLLNFLFLGSDDEFRKKHLEDYFEHYHNSLAAHLKLLSHDINEVYPKSAFYFDLKDKLPYGLDSALLILDIILVDPENIPTLENLVDAERAKTDINFSEKYIERLNGIVRDFVRWGYLDDEDMTASTDINKETGNQKSDVFRKVESFGRTIAEKEGIRDFNIKTKPMSTNGANYMGDLFYVDLIEDSKNSKTTNLFVKVANTPEHVRAVIPVNEIYKDEVFIYTTLAETYHELQEKHRVPEEKRFKFPKFYSANLQEMEEMLALENLAAQGYTLYDRFNPINWEYAKAAVEEIAKFHAMSYALQKENPETFKNILDRLPKISRSEECMNKMDVNAAKMGIMHIIGLVKGENKNRLQKYVNENLSELTAVAARFKSFSNHPAIIHTDYRASNVMVKYQGNEIVALKPVDYQGVFYGCPIVDILSFLFLGSDQEFRKQHLEDYFEHYYKALASHLKLLSQDVNEIYPKYAFYFDLKDKMRTGILSALFMLNLVLVDTKHDATIEDMMHMDKIETEMKPSELYLERLNGIVRDFVRWGFLDEEDKAVQNTETISIDNDLNKESAVTSSLQDTSTLTVDSEPINMIRNMESFIGSIAVKEGHTNFKLKTTPVSTEGANYMADLYYVDVIEDGKEVLNLFVKAANTPEHVRKFMPTNDVYKHEAFMYTTLAGIYHKLQERHEVPEDKKFNFPKFYGANLRPMEEVLVFENLSAQGYILYDRFKSIDWEYAKGAVEELAKFHALSFALQKENPDDFEKIIEVLRTNLNRNEDLLKKFTETCMKGIPLIMNSVHSKYKRSLQKYIDDNNDKLMNKHFKPPTEHCAIIHADYRASNIMVKYKGDKVVALKPVDYQGGIYGSTITDILSILFLGSDEDFRREHLADYFEHYHNSLAAHLKLLSQDINEIFPKSAFYFQLKDRMLTGLEMALFGLHVILIDTKADMKIEDLIDPNKKQSEMKPSEQYVERLNGVLSDFVRWGFLSEEETNTPGACSSTSVKSNEHQTSS